MIKDESEFWFYPLIAKYTLSTPKNSCRAGTTV